MKQKWIGIACALVLALSLAGCGGSANSSAAMDYMSSGQDSYGGGAYDITPSESPSAAAGSVEEGTLFSKTDAGSDLLPQDGRKIILNADLTIEALDFDATCSALLQAMRAAGGYVASTDLYTPSYEGAQRTARYELRIPAAQYDSFLQGAGEAGNLVNKQESTQDVTSTYVDVEARLKSLRLQEERLYAMMEQAGELETLLAIQNQLTEVQYQIESYTAQQRTFDDLIAYSTVHVSVEEVRQITEKVETFGDRVSSAFSRSWRDFGYGVQDFAVGFIAALPSLLVLAVVVFLVVLAIRAAARHHKKIMVSRAALKPVPPMSSAPSAGGAGKQSPDDRDPDKQDTAIEPKYS